MSCDEAGRQQQDPASMLADYHAAFVVDHGPIGETQAAAGPPAEKWERMQACLHALEQLRVGPDATTVPDCAERPAVPEYRVPLRFGRFEIRGELGRGGHGIVYRAFDPVLKRDVALKVPRMETLASPALRERFLREARAVANLSHPHLVPVYEVGEVGPACYIASQFCSGPTLSQWMKQHPVPPAPKDAARLAAVLAETVGYVHGQGILHRDLKPDNVLLVCAPACTAADRGESSHAAASNGTGNGQPAGLENRVHAPATQLERPADWCDTVSPKLTDFGLAKLLEGEATGTRTGEVFGTPAYMSPEQAEGRSDEVGPASDVYALGVMLYELLTGRRPFAGNSDVDTLRLICDGRFQPPRTLRREIPRDLEAVCLICLENDPRRRYQRADDLAADLRRFVADRPVSVSGVGPVGRVMRWSRRRPLIAALSGTVAASLIFGVCGIWWQGRVAEAHRREAEANFQQAHQAVREFHELLYGDDAYDDPVFQPLRAEVLQKALGYYQAFLDRHAGDPQLTAHVAEAWYQTGFIAQTLDDRDEAVRRYRQALPLWQALTESHPDVREHRNYLAKTCDKLGLLLHAAGQLDEAERLLTRAAAIQEDLCRRQPEDHGLRCQLADNLYHLGALLKARRRDTPALDALRRCQAVREGLIQAEHDLPYQRRELARTQIKIGYVLFDLGQLEAAAEMFQCACDSALGVSQGDLADPEDQFARASAIEALGYVNLRRGDDASATRLLGDAGTDYAALVGEFPTVRLYREGLAANRRWLAETLISQARMAEAHSLLEEACTILEDLESGAPDPIKAACMLGNAYYQLGSLDRDLGAAEAALDSYAQAERAYRRVIEQAPAPTSAVQCLSATRYQTALLLTGLGRVDAARDACEDAVHLRRRLADEIDPGNEQHHQLLNRYSGRLAAIEGELMALEGKAQ